MQHSSPLHDVPGLRSADGPQPMGADQLSPRSGFDSSTWDSAREWPLARERWSRQEGPYRRCLREGLSKRHATARSASQDPCNQTIHRCSRQPGPISTGRIVPCLRSVDSLAYMPHPDFPGWKPLVVVGKISLEPCAASGCRYGVASCFKVQQQPILKGRIADCQPVTVTLQCPRVQFGKIGFRPRVPVNGQPSFICPRKAAFAQTATHPRQHGTRCIGTVRTRNPLDMDTLCQLLDDLEIFRFGQGAFSSNHEPFVESPCAPGAATWSLSPCHKPTVTFPSPIADAGLRRRSKCEVCRLCGLQDTLCANPCQTARP